MPEETRGVCETIMLPEHIKFFTNFKSTEFSIKLHTKKLGCSTVWFGFVV